MLAIALTYPAHTRSARSGLTNPDQWTKQYLYSIDSYASGATVEICENCRDLVPQTVSLRKQHSPYFGMSAIGLTYPAHTRSARSGLTNPDQWTKQYLYSIDSYASDATVEICENCRDPVPQTVSLRKQHSPYFGMSAIGLTYPAHTRSARSGLTNPDRWTKQLRI